MEFAMWAYPWDVIDEGVGSFTDRMTDIGVDEVNLATNYHSVQAFLPHNPKRKTFFARASSYFQPDDNHYGRLSPVPNEQVRGDDWLARIADAFGETDLVLNSWTVGCHNSRLGMANRDLTLESPFGDSLVFGLCPSRPAVQEYLTGLLSDLSSRGSFKRIELETFDYFYGTGFGWHHDKYHLELGKLGEFLFGLCFCDACRDTAHRAGVDVAAARESARTGVEAVIEGDLASDSVAGWLRANQELAAYVDTRTATLTDVYRDLRDVTDVDVDLGRYTGFLDVGDAWMHGADLEALGDHLDYYTVIAYESNARDAVRRVRTADRLTTDVPLHAGVMPGYPAIDDGDTVRGIVDGMADAGVERISFYNYGLLPKRSLEWIGRATEPYR